MMKIVILHSGPLAEIIVASSLNNGIKKQAVDSEIYWVVEEENKYVFQYSKYVKKVFSFEDFIQHDEEYDLLINLWPNEVVTNSKIKEYTGFGFYKEFSQYEEVLTGNSSFAEMSNFKLYFYLSGLTWKGEGYDIGYYPRTRKKHGRIGMSAANANLRNYVIDNLELGDKKIWYIPYRKNIFRKMDEINRCEKIITDDLLTFHLSMDLRKYVYYLETYPHNLKLEMFNNGQSYPVPYSYLK